MGGIGDTLGRAGLGVATGGFSELHRAGLGPAQGYQAMGGNTGGMGGKGGKNGPPVPDYQGAAEAQSRGSHPDINTPWGGIDWTEGPNGSWSGQVNLSPYSQQALESQQQIQSGRSDLAQGLLGRAGNDLSQGIDWQSFGPLGDGSSARDQAISGAYSQATSRLDPRMQQEQTSLQAQLAGQGLNAGDAAYDNAMGNFGRQKTDAYNQAMYGAIGQGTAAQQATFGQNLASRQQGIGEAYQQQYGNLNALNAALAGQQVGMPSFPGMSAPGTNYMGAAQNQYQAGLNTYNAGQMQQQGMANGLGSLLPLMMFA
jgi:hypothetical protein